MPTQKKKPLSAWSTFWHWLDCNILFLLSTFLLCFIPLYPKIPLFEAIPGYIVRVRFEDMLMLIAGGIWLIQVIRKKITWKSPLFRLISGYAAVGFFSLASAVFITQTIPQELLHIGKSTLHFLRYLEYFFLFLMMYASIHTPKQAKFVISSIVITVIAVSFYGLGQKYWYWPVYSTMNREFSKGVRLYLTEHARVQSTFGGHYDLGAYLVIVLPLLLSFAYLSERKWEKWVFHLAHAFGLWLLVVSASRASFVAYFLSLAGVIIFASWREKTVLHKITSFVQKSLGAGFLIFILLVSFGADMQERFLQVLSNYPEVTVRYHQINGQRKLLRDQLYSTLGIIKLEPPKNSIGVSDSDLDPVLTATDQQPISSRPSDVYKDIPDLVQVATTSADGTLTTITIEKERTWSENALKYGLSMGIRLDTLWPNALKGFMRNPLLGSGYATLNKESTTQFTEAESTDNNFLRVLGETGLLGFLTFFGVIFVVLRLTFRQAASQNPLHAAAAIGLFAGSIGLMANASYIDVYAASKVAFTYWGIVGCVLAIFNLPQQSSQKWAKTTKQKKP